MILIPLAPVLNNMQVTVCFGQLNASKFLLWRIFNYLFLKNRYSKLFFEIPLEENQVDDDEEPAGLFMLFENK